MSFSVASASFSSGDTIPTRHTEDGDDLSPPLKFGEPPPGTHQLVLICDDPDAPTPEPWVHWLLYNLSPETRELTEGIARAERLASLKGACQGKNTWNRDNLGYRGPAPPPGKPHRYFFKLYALDTVLTLPPGLDKNAVLKAIEGHVIGQAELIGVYERK